jgi:hypothetical protein
MTAIKSQWVIPSVDKAVTFTTWKSNVKRQITDKQKDTAKREGTGNHGGAREGAGRKPVHNISMERVRVLKAQGLPRREIARRFNVCTDVIVRIEREIEKVDQKASNGPH